jgi:hypothetical protein
VTASVVPAGAPIVQIIGQNKYAGETYVLHILTARHSQDFGGVKVDIAEIDLDMTIQLPGKVNTQCKEKRISNN